MNFSFQTDVEKIHINATFFEVNTAQMTVKMGVKMSHFEPLFPVHLLEILDPKKGSKSVKNHDFLTFLAVFCHFWPFLEKSPMIGAPKPQFFENPRGGVQVFQKMAVFP